MRCSHARGAFCGKEGIANFRLPIVSACANCDHYSGPPRGLGDRVHRVLEATGVQHVVKTVVGNCGGCAARRQALNEKFPSSANAGIDETPKKQ
jgi:hypothetical protein